MAPRGLLLAIAAALALAAGAARVFAAPPPGAQPADSCVSCHRDLDGRLSAPTRGMADDIHTQRGLGCAGCHGGDPKIQDESAMDRSRGYRGAPSPGDVPAFCGRCHSDPAFMRRFNPTIGTDQLAQYRTSIHGQRLAKGDDRVARCTSCHGVHPVRAVTDAQSPVYPLNVPQTCARCHAGATYMKPYGIPTNQYAQYRKSVHGVALLDNENRLAPACNNCHGNHGAAPPGFASVANVCAQCHSATQDLFVRSPHKSAFDAAGLAECTECHGQHTIAPTSDALLDTVCADCHDEGSAGLRAAAAIHGSLRGLESQIEAASASLARAEDAGVEVSDAKLAVQDAKTRLILARNTVHTADPPKVATVTRDGLAFAGRASAAGRAALAEVQFRRRGLAVSLGIIVLVAVVLYLRIREIDRTSP